MGWVHDPVVGGIINLTWEDFNFMKLFCIKIKSNECNSL